MITRRLALLLVLVNGLLMAAIAWRLVDLERDVHVLHVQLALRAAEQKSASRSSP